MSQPNRVNQAVVEPPNHPGRISRGKFQYSDYQVAILEKHFERSQYVTKESRQSLSQLTLLPEDRIKVQIILLV